MSCVEPRPFVDAYLDGELDLAAALALEQHLAQCDVCSEACAAGRRLRSAIGADAMYFRAPAELRDTLAAAAGIRPQRTGRRIPGWLTAAMPLAAAAVLILAVLTPMRPERDAPLVDEVVSGHVRSLMADHLTDVASTDRHTVKPWFEGKLDFAPSVVDLADHGFPLVGGRLDYLGKRPVAALVYARQRHFINLFSWPEAGAEIAPQSDSSHGFQVVHWRERGMSHWAISDLNGAELGEFASLARERFR